MRARLGAMVVFATLMSPSAQGANGERRDTVAQAGNLLRLSAAVDEAVDVYRLALLELVPSLRKLCELAVQSGTQPTTELPTGHRAVVTRLASALAQRVSANALPSITRAYHVEAVDALGRLAEARTMQEVVGPSRAMLRAMQHVVTAADDVIDLYSRERPTADTVLTANDALDGIQAALDELEVAEANVHRLQRRGPPSNDPLQAFMRLDVALGHALDMIAAARQAGVPIGIELPQSTAFMQEHVASLRHHLAELHEVVEDMGERPRFAAGDVQAAWMARPDGGADVQLQWVPPPQGDHTVAALRIYRRMLPGPLSDGELAALQCDAGRIMATQKAKLLAQAGAGDAMLVAQLPPGRAAWTEQLPAPAVPAAYRMAAVTAFGVERQNQEEPALTLPKTLTAPLWVSAHLPEVAPEDPAFYRDADAVHVVWAASPSDVVKRPRALRFASDHNIPVVRRYEVWRDSAGTVTRIGRVGPGVTQWVDRPSQQELKAGVRYTVDAVDIHKVVARSAGACAPTPVLLRDLGPAFAEAQAGAGHMTRPNAWERRVAAQLADGNALLLERKKLAQRHTPAEQEAWLQRFWQDQPTRQKITWYKEWLVHMSDAEREAFLSSPPSVAQVAARDLPWVMAESFVREHQELVPEVQRWWQLLDDKTRDLHVQGWRKQRDHAHLQFVASGALSTDGHDNGVDWPVRLWTWYKSRDSAEQDRIAAAWEALPPAVQQQRVATFFAALPPQVAHSLRWPDWEQRSPREQADFLQHGFMLLPDGLWPQVLAWIGWETLSPPERITAIRSEVDALHRFMSFCHYTLRPLDLWLDFKLVLALLVLALGLLSGIVVQYAGQRSDEP